MKKAEGRTMKPRAYKPRANRSSMIQPLLEIQCATMAELMAHCDLTQYTVKNYLNDYEGEWHICGWVPFSDERDFLVAVYRWGRKPNVQKPPPKERVRNKEVRVKTRDPFYQLHDFWLRKEPLPIGLPQIGISRKHQEN